MLDTSIRRIRQITAAISERIDAEERLKRSYVTWQTRTLASFVITAAQTDEAGQRKLQDAVESLSMEPAEDVRADPEGEPGTPDLSFLESDDEALERALRKNAQGSYEQLMSQTGGR